MKKKYKTHKPETLALIYINRVGPHKKTYREISQLTGVNEASVFSISNNMKKYVTNFASLKSPSGHYMKAREIVLAQADKSVETTPEPVTKEPDSSGNVTMTGKTYAKMTFEENFSQLEETVAVFNQGVARFLENEKLRWDSEHHDILEENRKLKEEQGKGFLSKIRKAFSS